MVTKFTFDLTHKFRQTYFYTDEDIKFYQAALQPVNKLLGSTHLSLLKLSLSMHSLLPRVQAHFQIAQEIIEHGDCQANAFVTIGNKIACNSKELQAGLKKAITASSEKIDEDIYSFDHVYSGSENNTITTILYGQIGTDEFKELHEILKKSVNDGGKIRYVARHYVKNLPKIKARLSGYGVELHLKSTEYKSQDDSPRTDDAASKMHEVDVEVEGFDFKRLKY